ncbi:MAG: helix-turn-helix domain-containing protein [Acidimicrobiales bacterium]
MPLSDEDPKRRIVHRLKRADAMTAVELASDFGVTPTAIRQHLEQLEAAGLVRRAEPSEPSGRGRPAVRFVLTELAAELFPDRHSDLTIELIESIRTAIGEPALDAVITKRSERQEAAYRERLGESPVAIRASRLAEVRSAEGYMAEIIDGDDGSLTLVEHHCPICDAASVCQALCRDEQRVFAALFADVATVERTSHLLAGDTRCAYRIRPIPPPAP